MSSDWRDLVDRALEASVVASFSNIGCRTRRRLFDWPPIESFRSPGRVVAVTGATSGLGLAAARILAGLDAEVLLVGRNEDKLRRAQEEITTDTGNERLRTYRADLGSLDEVRSLVDQLTAGESRLDTLVHNAGALYPERRESADGHELTFATMVLAPHVLTHGLAPLLEADGGGRIVTVSSGGMYTERLDVAELEHPTSYKGSQAYARAKRAQVVLAEVWADQWEDRIVSHSMHPGWAATPGVGASLPTFDRVMRPLLRTPEEGADTIVWLAVADEPTRTNGRFWLDRAPRRPHRLSRTREPAGERTRLLTRLVELSTT